MNRILPMLYNTDMVKAILENRKTVTRRLIKQEIKPNQEINLNGKGQFEIYNVTPRCGIPQGIILKPPYEPGDILYVRETWQFMPCIECSKCENCEKDSYTYSDKESISEGCFIYRADYPQPERINWKPSIHMPKEAARIWLKVTNVCVEKLHEMTMSEAWKEGIHLSEEYDTKERAYILAFADLWDSTIKKSDYEIYSWDANPYVWVIEFEQCTGIRVSDESKGE